MMEKLLDYFGVLPEEMVIVTSRSITASQMEHTYEDAVLYKKDDIDIALRWGDADHEVRTPGIRVMTYDKFMYALRYMTLPGSLAFSGVRILVFDECHTMFSDLFMKGIEWMRVWLREAIFSRKDLIVIGITATPRVMEIANEEIDHLPIVNILPEVLVGYKAKHLICTNFGGAMDLLISERLQGRSIMMCKRKEECRVVYETIKDSGIVISQSNKSSNKQQRKSYGLTVRYEKYMDDIREYIGENCDIPQRIMTSGGPRDLNLLVTTSTFREGFNLNESSNVRNVFVFGYDDMQITQFLGRCRYDVDNLIVVELTKDFKDNTCYGYFTEAAEAFSTFLSNGDSAWYNTVSHLLYGDISDVEFYGDIKSCHSSASDDQDAFEKNKLRAKAARMLDTIPELVSEPGAPIYISRGQHDVEVMEAADETGLFQGRQGSNAKITLRGVMMFLLDCGCNVEVFSKLPDGTRRKCYCIYR